MINDQYLMINNKYCDYFLLFLLEEKVLEASLRLTPFFLSSL